MRIRNRNTNEADYSQREYHRIMFNYLCNPQSYAMDLYIFERPTGLYDRKNIQLFENDRFKYYKHKGIILSDFIATVVWNEEYACFGYKKQNDENKGFFTPFSIHDELHNDFLKYIEVF